MTENLGLIAELLSYVGFGGAAVFLIIFVIAKLLRLAWVETDAVVLNEGGERRLRWLDDNDELRERAVEEWELSAIGDDDHCRVRYRSWSPEDGEIAGERHGTRLVGILTLVFVGIGVVAVIGGFVLVMIEG